MNIKLKYQSSPIEILSLQCPNCLNWFINDGTSDIPVEYEQDIYHAKFTCPLCSTIFTTTEDTTSISVKVYEQQVLQNSYTKKTVWEKI